MIMMPMTISTGNNTSSTIMIPMWFHYRLRITKMWESIGYFFSDNWPTIILCIILAAVVGLIGYGILFGFRTEDRSRRT